MVFLWFSYGFPHVLPAEAAVSKRTLWPKPNKNARWEGGPFLEPPDGAEKLGDMARLGSATGTGTGGTTG